MDNSIEFKFVRSQRSVDTQNDEGRFLRYSYGPEPELTALLDKVKSEAEELGIDVKLDILKMDHGKMVQHQFPTIDVETVVTLSLVVPASTWTVAKAAELVKTILEIVDKSLDIEKKLRARSEFGDHHKRIAVSMKTDDEFIPIKNSSEISEAIKTTSGPHGEHKSDVT